MCAGEPVGATFLFSLFFRRANGSHGFIPANYVQEIEQKLVAVEVKKPVVIKDVRKVKKTQYVKQPTAPATNQRSGTVRVPGIYFLAALTQK